MPPFSFRPRRDTIHYLQLTDVTNVFTETPKNHSKSVWLPLSNASVDLTFSPCGFAMADAVLLNRRLSLQVMDVFL